MSNERLERIKERVNYHGHLDDDIEWLIEQAGIGINTSRDKQALIKSNIALNKRVQELEEQLYGNEIQMGHKRMYGECNKDYAKLLRQNKRYREALEFYAETDNYGWEISFRPQQEIDCMVIDDGGHTARKALENDTRNISR